MCIVAVAHRVAAHYPLILAANRDERHARPSAAADWWQGPGSLLAGRDLTAGGTWLGVTGAGRVAAVTNIFEPGPHSAQLSRGSLVRNFLLGSAPPSEFAEATAATGADYGPFNLVLRDADELRFISNRNAGMVLDPGIHVFSNNTPGLHWAKLGVLAAAIERAVESDDPQSFLLETLSGPAARGPLERASESMFVVGDEFGTRCTTVLMIDDDGRASFVEQRFAARGKPSGCSEFAFELQT